MAFGRLDGGSRPKTMSDINMTPLIDVMLVLLVIFMIAAPLMTSRLQLDLPKVQAHGTSDRDPSIHVAIDAHGHIFLADNPVDLGSLKVQLGAEARKTPAAQVELRADRAAAYGQVAEVIGVLQDAGLSRIGFVTDAPAPATGRP